MSSTRVGQLVVACGCAFTLLTLVGTAHADLIDDVSTLVDAFGRSDGLARRLPPQFVVAAEVRRIAVDDARDDGRRCMTLVALAERSLSFTLRAVARDAAPSSQDVARSRAGVAVVTDCSTERRMDGVELVMGRHRGAVELVTVGHDGELSRVDSILPTRALGPVDEQGPATRRLRIAPLTDRVDRAEAVARGEGAKFVWRLPLQADQRGRLAISLRLPAGCHRVAVLADQTAANRAVDVDAEVRLPHAGVPLRTDQSHNADARLDFCTAETEQVELRLRGAGGQVPLVVIAGFWPLPPGLPQGWGDDARAGLAWALHRRVAPIVRQPPILTTLGPAGVTLLPMTVDPGACYLVAVALARGQATAGRLTVTVGADTRYDDARELPRSAAVTFCASPHDDLAKIQVDMRGRAASWLLTAWRLGDVR